MPTIPGYDSQRQPSTRQQSLVRSNPVDMGIDETLEDVNQQIRQRDENEYARAKSRFLVLKAEQDNAYDDDQDFSTIQERWEGVMREGMGVSASQITNPVLREQFQTEMEVQMATGAERMRDIARVKYRDKELGDITQEVDILLKEAVRPGSDVEHIVGAVGQRYRAAADAGVLDREAAEKLRIAFTNEAAVSKLTAMAPGDRLQVFKTSPAWLDNIGATRLAQLKKEAKEDALEEKTLATALHLNSLDEEDANTELRKIKDSDEYRMTRLRLLELRSDDDNALQEKQQELYTSLMPDIRTGKLRVEDLEGIGLRPMDLTPAQYDNLRREQEYYIKMRAGEYVPTWSDQEVNARLEELIFQDPDGRMAEAMKYFSENSSRLNMSDRRYYNRKFQQVLASIRGTGKEESFKGLETTRQLMTRMLDTNNVTDVGVRSRVWDAMEDWNEDFFAQNQRPPNHTEIREQLSLEFLEVRRDPDAWLFTEDAYVHEMTDEDRDRFFEAARVLRSIDPYISREEIVRRYESMLMGAD